MVLDNNKKDIELIDKNYLIDNIKNWIEIVGNDAQKEILTQVIHCIQAKDVIIKMQALIDEINYQQIEPEGLNESEIRDAVIYNGAIQDTLDIIKNTLRPNYEKSLIWDKSPTAIEKKYIEDLKKEDIEL